MVAPAARPTTKLGQPGNDVVKRTLPALLVPALLLLAAGAQAADESSSRREPPRTIFGQTEQTEFEFREIRPLRRSGASTRQAYFGSGACYSETLSRPQAQMSAIRARTGLELLERGSGGRRHGEGCVRTGGPREVP